MATILDLQASVVTLEAAAVNATALIATLQAKVASLEATTTLTAADQASLDASVATLGTVTQNLVAAVPAAPVVEPAPAA